MGATRIRLIIGLTLAGLALQSAAADPAPLTPQRMWQLARLAAPALSPDGTTAAVAVTRFDLQRDAADTDLWLVPAAGGPGRTVAAAPGGESEPAWSPDGRRLAFVAQRKGDDAPQIYLVERGKDKAKRLTRVPTGVYGIRWFPDSTRLAFISRIWPELSTWGKQNQRLVLRKERKVSAMVYDTARTRYWDHWVDDRQAHLFWVGIDGGDPLTLTLGTGLELPYRENGAASYDISPRGDEIAFTADSSPRPDLDSNLDIFLLRIGEKNARNLTADNTQGDFNPVFSPDGAGVVFGRQLIRGFYGDRTRLMLHDRATGTNRELAPGFDYSCSDWRFAPDGGRLFFVADERGHMPVYAMELPGGAMTRLTAEGSHGALAVEPGGAFLVALRQGFSEPPTLVRVDIAEKTTEKISTFNDAVLADVRWGEVRNVTYTGADGASIQMWIILPPDYEAGQKRPLMMLIHGGPHNAITDMFQWRWNAQVFAGWGYVCAWPNFHGSSGFGNDFTASILGNWADRPYEDVMRATQWLVDQQLVDSDRMVAAGASYGGYLASVVLGRPNPYKALVAHAAVYNLYTQYASDYGAGERADANPHFWVDESVLRHTSPHLAAGSFKTPTLVVHGERDHRVYPGNGLELFQTLQARGVPSRLIYFPDENHWVLKPNNSLFWYDEVKRWFEKWLTVSGER